MIKVVEIILPQNTEKLEYLRKMVAEWEFNKVTAKGQWEIVFKTKEADNPWVNFKDEEIGIEIFRIGELEIGFNLPDVPKKVTFRTKPEPCVFSDAIGKYLQVKWPKVTYPQMNFEQLFGRLKGHIKGLDHAGVNISNKILNEGQFKLLINKIASESYLISYPTNDSWKFMVPETKENTMPLFEFVGDFKYEYPELQIDIQTDLSPQEVIKMFPKPYGYYDPDPKTGDYCVSVFIYTGWKDTSLRVDVRFQIDKPNWKEWLVKEGKRVV